MAALPNTDFLVPGVVSERAGRTAVEGFSHHWKSLKTQFVPHFSGTIGEFVLFLWIAGVVAFSLLMMVGFIQGMTP